jgi:ferric-dicitrate binding protein FerR (iron transport regulator)
VHIQRLRAHSMPISSSRAVQAACVGCWAGSFSTAVAATSPSCAACGYNTYASAEGASACTACSGNSYVRLHTQTHMRARAHARTYVRIYTRARTHTRTRPAVPIGGPSLITTW